MYNRPLGPRYSGGRITRASQGRGAPVVTNECGLASTSCAICKSSHLARALRSTHDIYVEERIEQPYFEEEQRFPLWIKVIVLLPVVVLAYSAILMWFGRPMDVTIALIFTALALFFLLIAVPNFILKLVIRLDSSHLHLRIYPLRLPVPFLPPRIWDIPLSEISRWEVHTYRALLDREYWGPHLWGLGSAFGGDRYLYGMKPGPGLFSGRGVQLQLRSGERLFLGSEHPEELTGAITLAKRERN
jgi:hypothetical protein